MGLFLSADHLAALAVTAGLCLAVPCAARAWPGRWVVPFSRGLAVLLLAGVVLYPPAAIVLRGSYSLEFDLPLHLTDAATVVAALALWSPRPLLFELAYFWGLAGSLQAVLTPSLGAGDGFPSFFYWHYFVTHSGVVLAAVFLAFGRRLTPRPGAVGRVFLATAVFAGLAAVANVLTGGNYMFLRERPPSMSLLDVMGPWPWYILTGAVVALALFTLLDAPFRRRRSLAA